MSKRMSCFVLAALLLAAALNFTSCSPDTMPKASAASAASSGPTWHITVYSPEIEKGDYTSYRKPKYTVTTDDLEKVFQYPYDNYGMLTIPLSDGQIELVSTSLVEIKFY